MTTSLSKPVQQEQITKVALTGVFLSAFLGFVSARSLWRRKQPETELSTMDLVLLGFSVFRLGRMVAFDRVAEPFRAPVAQTVPDATGAGESVEPRGEGARQALGQLITCPICAGTWISAILVYGLQVFPAPTRLFMTILGATGFSEFLNSLNEAFCWVGQLGRVLAGAKLRKNDQHKA